MVVIITGESHTGKTNLAQKLMEKFKISYLSIDHIKMGLMRSEYCNLTPFSNDENLTNYLWPVIREIIKTNIENEQNIIIEGCYIPFNYRSDFEKDYIEQIKYICLIFSEEYILKNIDKIKSNSCCIENRLEDDYFEDIDKQIIRNKINLENCIKYELDYILIDNEYNIEEKAIEKIKIDFPIDK